jgi:spermidine/putrescine transport system ATP-binding protein
MRAELRAIQKRTNVTFVYITHDQGEALAMSDRVGVMSNGKLQQVAVPQEIYNKPANGFVASFVGENNIFSGKIGSVSGNAAQFETSIGTFKATVGPNAERAANAKLYVRPEHARLVSQRVNGENAIPVEVADVAFEGNFISIQARDPGGRILVSEARNDGQASVPSPGEKLLMVFDPERAVILADDTPMGAAASA